MCSRYLIALVFFVFSGSATADIHNTLRSNNLLDAYLIDLIREIAPQVVSNSDRNRGVQINGPHRSNMVNIYMIDADRIRGEPLQHLDIDIGTLHRNFFANKRYSAIFIDTGFLRELVTLNMMVWEQRASTPAALATFEVRGKAALRGYWDPAQNPLVNSREAGQSWLISLRGVLAFLLAHELGHIDLPITSPGDYTTPFRAANQRQRDLYWACPERVHGNARLWREKELAADEYAVRILTRLRARHYELGAGWYVLYLLQKSMIGAIPLASPGLDGFLRQYYGGAYNALRSSSASASGTIESFYPKSHPSIVTRLANILFPLTGERPDPEFIAWEQRIRQECMGTQ